MAKVIIGRLSEQDWPHDLILLKRIFPDYFLLLNVAGLDKNPVEAADSCKQIARTTTQKDPGILHESNISKSNH